MTQDFNYHQLISFIYVAKKKSFSSAARELGKGRSTISEHIDAFEFELGGRLFEKKGRLLELTPLGKEIFSHSLLLQKQIMTWRKVLQEATDQSKNKRCRIAYTDVVPKALLLNILKQVSGRGEQIELIEVSQSIAYEMLDNQLVDLMIAPAVTADREKEYDSEWKLIGAMPFRFYAHKAFFSQYPVNISDMVSSTQILPRAYVNKYEDNHLIFTTNNISITDLSLVKEALQDRVGWAFLPMHLNAKDWEGICEIKTDLGRDGFITPISARWRNGEYCMIANVLGTIEDNIALEGRGWFMDTSQEYSY